MFGRRLFPSILFGLMGGGSLAFNLYGYDRDLYRPEDHVQRSRPGDIELSFGEVLALIEDIDAVDQDGVDAVDNIDGIDEVEGLDDSAGGGSETERAIALLDAVQRRMVHCDGPALRVSPADNWLIWGLSFVAPGFARYEFVDPERALRRGLGLCGQQALALVGLLAERGFTAGRLRLRGHMTAWVYADGAEIVLDPDFGTVLPFNIEHAEANLDSVRRLYYETSAQRFSSPVAKAQALDIILAAYATNNKRSGPGLADSAGGGALAIEHALYALKWALPLLLLAAAGWLAGGAHEPVAKERELPPAARRTQLLRSDRASRRS